MKLIALWSFTYDDRPIREGQSFKANDADAALMLARGSVVEDTRETMEVFTDAIKDVFHPPRKKRGYKRRDMTAEDQ